MSARRAALLCALLLAAACAKPPLPPLDAAQLHDSERESLQSYHTLRTRLFRVDYALRVGRLKLCAGLLAPDAGLLLRMPDAGGAGLEVLDVVPRSTLARAGAQPGDRLLELDGSPLGSIDDFNARLGAQARFTLQRGGENLVVSVALPDACNVPVKLSRDPSLMTFQRGSSVAVPYGLLEAVDEPWLAIAVAHQIAHFLIDLADPPVADPEATADRLGLQLAAEAGYDVGLAPAFWEWLATENPWRIGSTRAFRLRRPGSTPGAEVEYPASQLHLGIARRLAAIRASVDEILAAQRRLLPARDSRPRGADR